MIDKKELISTYLQQFGSHYQISRLLNPTLRIDDEFISHFFEQVVDQYGETFAITEEEKTEIERKIKSQYCIFQDEGAALVGDYEHDFMWYANLQAQEDYDEYYWPRYKAHLENKTSVLLESIRWKTKHCRNLCHISETLMKIVRSVSEDWLLVMFSQERLQTTLV